MRFALSYHKFDFINHVANYATLYIFFNVQGLCEWDPAHHNEVYRVWHMMVANHYRSKLGDICREKNPAKRRARASFMTDAQHAEMEEWWATMEFNEQSARGKTMRALSLQSSN